MVMGGLQGRGVDLMADIPFAFLLRLSSEFEDRLPPNPHDIHFRFLFPPHFLARFPPKITFSVTVVFGSSWLLLSC